MSEIYNRTYFVTGGGTGGHIYPAVAVGRELLRRDDVEKVYYIGNPKKLEKDIVKKENFEWKWVKHISIR